MKDIDMSIIKWATEKGIFTDPAPLKQACKTVEEAGEVVQAVAMGDFEELPLEIGDVYVTLVILSTMYGMSLDRCAEAAYDKISKRTGQMVDGVFVKDEH